AVIVPPIFLKFSAKTLVRPCAYGLPSWMVATRLSLSIVRTNCAASAPWTLSLCTTRRYPSKSGPRFGSVSFGAVFDGDTVAMPAFQRIGDPCTGSLEHLDPIATTTAELDASFVAAVWPPSALHPLSSPINLML